MAKRSIKRTNKVITLLAGIVLALGLLPMTALAEGGPGDGSTSDATLATTTPAGSAKAGSQAYQLWVGDVQVTEGNASNILGDGTAVYVGNGSKGTLTLKNASINEKHIWNDEGQDANIHAFGIDLTIELVGANTVGNGNAYAGIIANEGSSLTFKGKGSATAKGRTYGIWVSTDNLTMSSGSVYGYSASGEGIEAAKIYVNGGTLTGETGGNFGINGIHGGIELGDGMAVLVPEGGKIGQESLNHQYVVLDSKGNGAKKATIGPAPIPTYTVTYKVVNGTWSDGGTADKAETVAEGSTPASVPTGMKADTGYTGGEWDTNPATAKVTKAMTFTYTFALKKCKVTFVDEDGKTVIKSAAEYDYGTPAAEITKPADPIKGADARYTYTFAGWSPDIADVTADATYKATYTASPKKATLTFDLAGGKLDSKTGAITIEANVGDTVKLPAAPTRKGYTFKCWKGSEYAAGDKYEVEGDHTFTAEWIAMHTVTFNKNGHGKAPDAQTVEDGKTAKKPSNPTADGYTFGGWYTDKDCKNAYDFSKPVTSDITLYAKWTQKATSASGTSGKTANTGDTNGGVTAIIAVTAIAALCLAIFAFSKRRRRD